MAIADSPVVTIESGRVRGRRRAGVYSFKRVPYAAPPVGERRFRKPERAEPWSEVLDAADYGPVPHQHGMPGAFGVVATPVQEHDLAALLLNVWTPDPAAIGLPVFVWIHGGGYFAGGGSDEMYDGSHFARDGIVCVTINYRLGVEGFLCLGDEFPGFENSGCNGTADQVAALQWVRRNIASFGGDPNNVTIAGESAGAHSVATLMAAPAARGLFRRAISQSGGGHNVHDRAVAQRIGMEFLNRAGVGPGDVAALQSLDPVRVIEIQAAISQELMSVPDPAIWGDVPAMQMAFKPVAETDLVPCVPLEAIAAGAAKGIDLMVGWNNDECLVFVRDLSHLFSEEVVRGLLDAVFAPSGGSGGAMIELYLRNYPGAAPHEIAAIAQTDLLFRIPSIRLAEAQMPHATVRMFRFDWRSRGFDGGMGAYHISEVPFAFDMLQKDQSRLITGDGAPQALADAMHGAWVRFARDGDPEGDALPSWPTYDSDRRATIIFDDPCRLVEDPCPDERRAWERIVLPSA